jgi:hypothetical protein
MAKTRVELLGKSHVKSRANDGSPAQVELSVQKWAAESEDEFAAKDSRAVSDCRSLWTSGTLGLHLAQAVLLPLCGRVP